jgi:hypothetical protein
VEKQLLQIKVDLMNLNQNSSDLDGPPYVGLDYASILFMFNFTMNRFMLSKHEFASINNFPADYTRRYQRREQLKTKRMLQGKYLNALFLDDPFCTLKHVDLSIQTVEPASPAQHIATAFPSDTGEASTSQHKINLSFAEEEEDGVKISGSSQTEELPNPEQVKEGLLNQDYMAILDAPLDEDMPVVEDTPKVQSLVLEEKDDLLFVPKPPYNANYVNAQLVRMNRLMSKFGSSTWFKFTVIQSK